MGLLEWKKRRDFKRENPEVAATIEGMSDNWAAWWPWICEKKMEIEYFLDIAQALVAQKLRLENDLSTSQVNQEAAAYLGPILSLEKRVKALYIGLDGLLWHSKSRLKAFRDEWNHTKS